MRTMNLRAVMSNDHGPWLEETFYLSWCQDAKGARPGEVEPLSAPGHGDISSPKRLSSIYLLEKKVTDA